MIKLLQDLIATSSFSGEEQYTARIIGSFLKDKNVTFEQYLYNIWAKNKHFDPKKPSILLCSHHDTVRPNPGYTRDPFSPDIENGVLYGLGSNDAGASLVCLIAAFCHYYEQENLPFNLVLAAVAEEERTGPDGLEALIPILPPLDCAIIGEPTCLDLALAEKGLMVLDCTAKGRAGHAAREEGDSALYKAVQDIEWFRTYQFPEISAWLGPIKMSVTSIETPNKAHNVVPDTCHFIVDVRLTEVYKSEDILAIIRENTHSEIKPRSTRLKSTGISHSHPLVQAGIALGKKPYGSPTTSDKALLSVPALKVGPGNSARSHTADEYILIQELEDGVQFYIDLLGGFSKTMNA